MAARVRTTVSASRQRRSIGSRGAALSSRSKSAPGRRVCFPWAKRSRSCGPSSAPPKQIASLSSRSTRGWGWSLSRRATRCSRRCGRSARSASPSSAPRGGTPSSPSGMLCSSGCRAARRRAESLRHAASRNQRCARCLSSVSSSSSFLRSVTSARDRSDGSPPSPSLTTHVSRRLLFFFSFFALFLWPSLSLAEHTKRRGARRARRAARRAATARAVLASARRPAHCALGKRARRSRDAPANAERRGRDGTRLPRPEKVRTAREEPASLAAHSARSGGRSS